MCLEEFSLILGKTVLETERRKDGVFLWDIEELTFLIIKIEPENEQNFHLKSRFLVIT